MVLDGLMSNASLDHLMKRRLEYKLAQQGNYITPWVSDDVYAEDAAISKGVPKSKTQKRAVTR